MKTILFPDKHEPTIINCDNVIAYEVFEGCGGKYFINFHCGLDKNPRTYALERHVIKEWMSRITDFLASERVQLDLTTDYVPAPGTETRRLEV